LNPLKASYYDIVASEDCAGTNFFFENVEIKEIYEINEILSDLYSLINLSKHPIQLAIAKYKIPNIKKATYANFYGQNPKIKIASEELLE